MKALRHTFKPILLLAALISALAAPAAGNAADLEGSAFTNAIEQFQAGFYARSETAFSNFIARFPQSQRVPQALLFQARSALEDGRPQPAIVTLSTNLPAAAPIADQFQFWLGRALLRAGKPEQAAQTFGSLTKVYTNSPLILEAALGQAEAYFTQGAWPRVSEVIDNPAGAFQLAAVARGTNDPMVARGHLMVAHAWFKQRQYERSLAALRRVSDTTADPRVRWDRQFLVCRAELAAGNLQTALAGTTNLVTMSAADPALNAASTALQGDVLKALGRADDARKAYAANLGDNVPPDRRREAFFRVIELSLLQDQVTNAVAYLERFVAEHPADASSDVAWLALGELNLKQHQAGFAGATPGAAGGTNYLDRALESFNRLATNFPSSSYLGKAQLDRGWVFLEQGRLAESAAAFQAATNLLEPSDEQAVAMFKLADLQFQSGNVTNAISNYRRVIHDYRGFPRVQQELVDRALYQMVQAGITANDLSAASEAIHQITAEYPASPYAERSLLLYGQAISASSSPAAARKIFSDFITRYPSSPLVPEVQLAVARSFEREGNWPAAAAEYADWTAKFPNNPNLALAEFSRATAIAQSGKETNALVLFTNFVARFVTNPLAARAQLWIGDHYFNAGRLKGGDSSDMDFREAERNYQLLFTSISSNWPVTDLTYEAQVLAGRAAFCRQSWADATNYFINAFINTNCPVSIQVEATFAYGDTYLQLPSTNQISRFSIARRIFEYIEKIPRIDPNDPQIPRAWGRIADCCLQLAGAYGTSDPQASAENYADAYEFYRKIIGSPIADANATAQAHVGMGDVRHAQSLVAPAAQSAVFLKDALDQYLEVVYAPADERPDPWWIRTAAEAAGKICERQKRYRQAIEIYTRAADMIPVLRLAMEKRIKSAREKESLGP